MDRTRQKGSIMTSFKQGMTVAVICASLLSVIAGCSGNGQSTTDKPAGEHAKTTSSNDEITVEQLPWNVEEGIDNGDRRVMVSFTNNTNHDITEFEVDYSLKADITDEQIAQAFEGTASGVTPEDVRNTSLNCTIRSMTGQGESATGFCDYGAWYMTSMAQLDLAEPDILTVQYVNTDSNTLDTVYYDFNSKKNKGGDSTPLSSWPENSPRASMIPQPKSALISDLLDSEDQLRFDILGFSYEDFQQYTNECVANGWQISTSMDDIAYFVPKDGFSLDLMYSDDSSTLSVYLNKEQQ